MVMEQPKKPRKARRPIEAAQTKSFSNITRDSVCIRSKLLRLLLCICCQNDIHTHDSYGSTLKKKTILRVVFIYHRKHNKNETFFKPGPSTELLHFLHPILVPPSCFPAYHQLLTLPAADAYLLWCVMSKKSRLKIDILPFLLLF